MNQYLDANAIKECMAVHFELRPTPTKEFGRANLETIRNKQAWLLTNFRNVKGRMEHVSLYTHTHTLSLSHTHTHTHTHGRRIRPRCLCIYKQSK